VSRVVLRPLLRGRVSRLAVHRLLRRIPRAVVVSRVRRKSMVVTTTSGIESGPGQPGLI
jgi:hypothetical protein